MSIIKLDEQPGSSPYFLFNIPIFHYSIIPRFTENVPPLCCEMTAVVETPELFAL